MSTDQVSTVVVQPLAGPGLATRQGDLLLVCAETGAGVDDLLALLGEVAAAGADGSVLVRRVAALLANDFESRVSACAVSGPTPDGRLAVLVYGAATANVEAAGGVVSLSGADAITSVDRLIPGPITQVRLELPGAGPANPRARLDAGVVVAAGVLAVSAPSPVSGPIGYDEPPAPPVYVEPPAPPVYVEPPADSEFPVQADAGIEPDAATDPDVSVQPAVPSLPVREPGSAPELASIRGSRPSSAGAGVEEVVPAEDGNRPRVLGAYCTNGHFNDPRLGYCAACGAAMAETLVLQEGPRPTLGTLLLDDGSAFPLDLDYLLGREPEPDPEVAVGLVRPLRIIDPEGLVSRRHVRIALDGWDVHVLDLGSANGTQVQRAGEAAQPLSANQPLVLTPGAVVSLGRRWFRYEAVRQP